jgi:hypothetical protein
MNYINTTTLEYPLTEGALRTLYPNTSFPSPFSPPDGFAEVRPVPPPSIDFDAERVSEGAPQYEAGAWQQTWVVEPLPADVIQARAAGRRQALQDSLVREVQAHLDRFAKTKGYDSILSAATYATSTIPRFAADGQCAVAARDATWLRCHEVMAEVEAGLREAPASFAEFAPLLPPLTWSE